MVATLLCDEAEESDVRYCGIPAHHEVSCSAEPSGEQTTRRDPHFLPARNRTQTGSLEPALAARGSRPRNGEAPGLDRSKLVRSEAAAVEVAAAKPEKAARFR
jgi:hypothetical protein